MEDSKEEKELSDKYKDRLQTPKEQWIKYEGPEQLLKLVMEKRKEKGLKFKDEK